MPSRNSLEDLAEQLETGDWRAMSSKEVASKGDVESDARWASMTVGKLGFVKLKKSAPKDFEEHRQKLKLLGHHFLFLKMLQPNRREIADVTPFTFLGLGDCMLSKRVAKLTSENDQGEVVHQPRLKQVLPHDFYLGKKMIEELSAENPIGEALRSGTVEGKTDPASFRVIGSFLPALLAFTFLSRTFAFTFALWGCRRKTSWRAASGRCLRCDVGRQVNGEVALFRDRTWSVRDRVRCCRKRASAIMEPATLRIESV